MCCLACVCWAPGPSAGRYGGPSRAFALSRCVRVELGRDAVRRLTRLVLASAWRAPRKPSCAGKPARSSRRNSRVRRDTRTSFRRGARINASQIQPARSWSSLVLHLCTRSDLHDGCCTGCPRARPCAIALSDSERRRRGLEALLARHGRRRTRRRRLHFRRRPGVAAQGGCPVVGS